MSLSGLRESTSVMTGINLLTPSKTRVASLQKGEIKLGEVIGKGGFGAVYRGTCRGFQVAVKVPLEIPDGELLKDFQQEIRLLSSLAHPSLALFLGALIEPDSIQICMELLDGDVETILEQDKLKRRISLYQRVVWAQQAAQGMAWLHGAGVIHRDFKPTNLLYCRATDSVKVSDFGLSVVVGKEGTLEDGRMVGNPRYWAPEILLREPWTRAVDVYAFGLSLYTFVTRQEVFIEWWVGGGMNPQFVESVVDFDVRPKLPQSATLCPDSLRDLAMQCWDKDASKRPSFEDILLTLEKHVLLDCAIFDDVGKHMWRHDICGNHPLLLREVPWKTFIAAMEHTTAKESDPHSVSDVNHERVYLYKLFCNGFGALGQQVVSIDHFGRMLGFFKPLSDPQMIQELRYICKEHYFWGNSRFFRRFETEAFLRLCEPGTFIVRCANEANYRTEIKLDDGSIRHIAIEHEYQSAEYRVCPVDLPGLEDQMFPSVKARRSEKQEEVKIKKTWKTTGTGGNMYGQGKFKQKTEIEFHAPPPKKKTMAELLAEQEAKGYTDKEQK